VKDLPLPLDLLLSPVALAILGLCVGSFLNVVIHRLPLMLERQWWSDVAHQLADADSWRRVFGGKAAMAGPAPEHERTASSLSRAVGALPAGCA
jgi:leader peptidase (prepilin peptidase)/N-methyltransferase